MDRWEDRFKQAFDEYEPVAGEDLWKEVLRKREKPKKAAPLLSLRIAASAALVITAGAAIWFMSRNPGETPRAGVAAHQEYPGSAPEQTSEIPAPAPDADGIGEFVTVASIMPTENKAASQPLRRISAEEKKPQNHDGAGNFTLETSSHLSSETAITLISPAVTALLGSIKPLPLPTSSRTIPLNLVSAEAAKANPKPWARLRKLPLFRSSDRTLPERTAETWALLQPEGLHRLQDMARRPTTIEIIW